MAFLEQRWRPAVVRYGGQLWNCESGYGEDDAAGDEQDPSSTLNAIRLLGLIRSCDVMDSFIQVAHGEIDLYTQGGLHRLRVG